MKDKKFFNTPRGKAIIKLSLWGIFLIIVYMFATLGSPQEMNPENVPVNEEKEVFTFRLYSDMQEDLFKNNFAFIYKIQIGDKTYVYSGKQNENKILGLKETSEGNILRYYVEDGVTYKVIIDTLIEMEGLYQDIDVSLLDMKEFFASLKGVNYTVKKEEKIRTIVYDTQNYEVLVKTNLENIESILLKKGDISYTLLFESIGKIEEISYNM